MADQPYLKATLYVRQSIYSGFATIEAKNVSHGVVAHGECDAAVSVLFTPRHSRKPRTHIEVNDPSLVILDGWGHPKFENLVEDAAKPPPIEAAPRSGEPLRTVEQHPHVGIAHSDTSSVEDVDEEDAMLYPGWSAREIRAERARRVAEAKPYTLLMERFRMGSPEWGQAFSEFLQQCKSGGAVVLADYRGHDVKRKFRPSPEPAPAKPVPFLTAIMTVLDEKDDAKTTASSYSSADEIREPTGLLEGATKQVVVNAYERNSRARQACIAHYGSRCSVCDFDFGQVYGEIGRDFIHVHHLVPLSEIGKEYQIDPVQDLRPVCPNCHAMLHRRMPPLSVLELKERIKAACQRATVAQVQTLQELWHRYKGEWPSEMHITRWQGMSWSEAMSAIAHAKILISSGTKGKG